MPTTEVAILPLKAGSNPGNPDDASSAVLKETCATLQQQDGMQQIHFGMQEENPATLQMMINWDSKKSHENFMATGAYGPFMSRIGSIIDGPAKLVHVDFKPDGALPKVFAAPVTELATLVYDGEVTSGWEDGIKKATEWIGAEAEGYLGAAWGTTYEDIEEKGVKGKAVVLAIGWQSVQHHIDFTQRPDFRENIGQMSGGSKAVEMHHVALMNAL